MSSAKRESVRVLEECIDLQLRKSRDYQNEKSNIVQAMHYRRGVSTIHDMISQKLLRAQSLLEAYENGESSSPNFESLEDTYKDLINYASFAVSYIRGKMEGQNHVLRDMINRPRTHEEIKAMNIKFLDEIDSRDLPEEVESFDEEIEDDGFVTITPILFPDSEKQKIHKNPNKNASTEEKIKSAYFREVLPKGEVQFPRGEVNCTDPIQSTYVDKIVKDVGDRIDEAFETAKRKHKGK